VRSFADDCHDSFELGEHFIVREAHHAIATCCEPSIANLILPKARVEVVSRAVDLDDDLGSVAHEIDDVRAHRRLATKLQSINVARFDVSP
jgi:hypothetical protein